jgi:hypothetical protein
MLLGVSTALGRSVVNVRIVAAESLLEVSMAPGAWPDIGPLPASQMDIVYQIAWRPDEDAGVFELQPVEPSDTRDVRLVEPSPPVPWGWRMAPAPMTTADRRVPRTCLCPAFAVASALGAARPVPSGAREGYSESVSD